MVGQEVLALLCSPWGGLDACAPLASARVEEHPAQQQTEGQDDASQIASGYGDDYWMLSWRHVCTGQGTATDRGTHLSQVVE